MGQGVKMTLMPGVPPQSSHSGLGPPRTEKGGVSAKTRSVGLRWALVLGCLAAVLAPAMAVCHLIRLAHPRIEYGAGYEWTAQDARRCPHLSLTPRLREAIIPTPGGARA